MKKYTLLLIFLVSVLIAKGQFPPVRTIGDTLGPWTTITFEEPTPYINILPQAGNIWQIGPPHKLFLSNAYSQPNVIITDTSQSYHANNFSTFELIIGEFNTFSYMYDMFLDFRHKFRTDSLHDGGYITVSWDNGATWTNVIDDHTDLFEITPGRPWYPFGNTNLYDTNALLYNGEHGYSGTSNGWQHSCLAWYWLPVKKGVDFIPDTMRLRFNFISDSVPDQLDGWMIDEIRLFAIDLGSGIKEFTKGLCHSYFYPNPMELRATFILDRTRQDVHWDLTDVNGRLVSSGKEGICDEFTFDRNGVRPGIYYLKLYLDHQFVDIHKIIVAP